MPSRIELFGVDFDPLTLAAAARDIVASCQEPGGGFDYTVTPNVDHIVRLQDDREFSEIYRRARFVVADGVPLVWASRLLGRGLPERVNGTDLMVECCREAEAVGVSVFLLGGSEGTADSAAARLKERFPNLRVAGTLEPSIDLDAPNQALHEIAAVVQGTGADLVFVALGSPKQESWIARWGAATGARHAIGIGASFDFISGARRRAPGFVQTAGLEWCWRLFQEPRRLAGRYLVRDVVFFKLFARAVVERVGGRR